MGRILASDSFSRSPQARRFLEFVVERSLTGNGESLKAYTIGVSALGVKDGRSRPETNARMQAGRVRKLLKRYYDHSGREDPIEVELPTGGYEPRFSWHSSSGVSAEIASAAGMAESPDMTVAVVDFDSLSADQGDVQFCRGLTESIVGLLVRADSLRVCHCRVSPSSPQSLVLAGSLTRSGDRVRIICTLSNSRGETVWSERYDRVIGFGDFLPTQDELAYLIANQVGDPSVGAIARSFREPDRTNTASSATQAFYRFLAGRCTVDLDAARTLLELALPQDQGSATAHRAVVHAAYSCVLSLNCLVRTHKRMGTGEQGSVEHHDAGQTAKSTVLEPHRAWREQYEPRKTNDAVRRGGRERGGARFVAKAVDTQHGAGDGRKGKPRKQSALGEREPEGPAGDEAPRGDGNYLAEPSQRKAELLSAEVHAQLAISHDVECSLAHLAKALVHYHCRQRSSVERESRRVLALAAVAPVLRGIAGNLLCLIGNWDEGFAAIQESQRMPLHMPGYLHLGSCLFYLHRRGEAARALRFVELLELDQSPLVPLLTAACLVHLRRPADARRAIARLTSRDRGIGRRLPRQLNDLFLDSALVNLLLSSAKDAGLTVRVESGDVPLRYSASCSSRTSSSEIRIGILHSLSGTMAICETHLVDAALLAIDEINASGGVLGRPVRGIVADGASEADRFREQASQLIGRDQVVGIFGCWTSSSRKAVLPVVEKNGSLLWYPIQYEGLERSHHIIYTGSCLNQQIEPAVRWATKQRRRRCFLVGSDYVFPRTANRLIRALVEASGGQVVGEWYETLGRADFGEVAAQIFDAEPDIVYNTVNGADNIKLFSALKSAGVKAEKSPVMSFSLSELELARAGNVAQGHLACWSYFQSMESPCNRQLVQRFRRRYGQEEVLSDPTVTAYAQVHLWRDVTLRAGSTDAQAVLSHLVGSRLSLGGEVLEVLENNHVQRGAAIGRIRPDRQFDVVWQSDRPIAPKPWLGVDEVDLMTRDLVLGALRALPEMAEQNASLEGQMARLLY